MIERLHEWERVAKVAEESGETIEALIGQFGQNPRKGVVGDKHTVIKELLDVAVTALGAVESLNGNQGRALNMLDGHIEFLCERLGIEVQP